MTNMEKDCPDCGTAMGGVCSRHLTLRKIRAAEEEAARMVMQESVPKRPADWPTRCLKCLAAEFKREFQIGRLLDERKGVIGTPIPFDDLEAYKKDPEDWQDWLVFTCQSCGWRKAVRPADWSQP